MGNINNNGVARIGTRTRILQSGGLELKDGTVIQAGTADPTQTAQNMPAGSIYYDTTKKRAFQKMDAGSTTNFRLLRADEFTKEPTGFVDNSLITVTYNGTTDRSVVVTSSSGTVEFLLRGRLFAYASPWTVPTVLGGGTPITHTNSNGRYFLKIDPDTLAISFGTTVWAFTDLMICFAFKNATAQFGLRECHQLMPNQSHESDHYTKGTYIRVPAAMTTGTAFTATTVSTATANSNCPGIDAHTIYDEDIATPIAAWPEASYNVSDVYQSGAYTTAYRNGGSGVITFNTTAQLPYIVAGGGVGVLQYNPISSGSGALANVTEDGFVNVLAISLPTTADTESQKFRTIWLLGQQQFTTLAAAQLQSPGSWEYGELLNSITEAVAVQMYSYQYNASSAGGGGMTPTTVPGRAFLAALPVVFTGARNSQIGTVGVSPSDHQTLSNRSAVASHPASAIDVSSVTWTAGGVLSATQTTVEQALDKLSSTFAASGAVGLVSATTQTFTGVKTFETGIAITGGAAGASKIVDTGSNTININNSAIITSSSSVAFFTDKGSVSSSGACTLGNSSSTTTKHVAQINGADDALFVRNFRTTAGSSYGLTVVSGTNSSDYALNIANAALTATLGKCDGAGAWTFPINTIHTFGNTGGTAGATGVTIASAGANDANLRFNPGSTNIGAVDVNTASGILVFRINGSEKGRMNSSAEWTLGASGNVTAVHTISGHSLRHPGVTTTQRNAIANSDGMIVWNTTTGKLQVCTVSGSPGTWVDLH